MSSVTLQKRVQLMNLMLKTRPLKFHEMGMSFFLLHQKLLLYSTVSMHLQCSATLQILFFNMSSFHVK